MVGRSDSGAESKQVGAELLLIAIISIECRAHRNLL